MTQSDAPAGSRGGRSTETTRRRVLMAIGGAGFTGGCAQPTGQQPGTIELGGQTEGWQGRAPPDIAGQTNPTLTLESGRQYEVTWENLDGQPHNFVIRDADGNDVVRSELVSERGATQTVTFTATEAMTTYLCEVHPTTMMGDVSIGGGQDTPTTTTTTPTGTDGEDGFFPPGPSVSFETLAEGMTAPTDFAIPDDGSGRQFVADQTGQVWVVTSDGRQDTPFMDVSDRMVTLGEFRGSYADPDQEYEERGLLGIDFHPAFADNGQFYLHYSAPANEQTPDGWSHVETVSEFTTTDDGMRGDTDSERIVLEIQKPQYNHDAGPMAFGSDDHLYVPMGDGGGANDDMYGHVEDWYDENTGGNGQDVTENLLGSVLRIDVDSQDAGRQYGIPDDNPFVGTDGLDEIYAYGFRNPFGVSFDSEGHLFVADAGQNLFEEVDVVESGGNYGWNVKEGTHCFSTEDPSNRDAVTDCPSNEPDEAPYNGGPLIDPVIEFPHTHEGESVGITVIGGHRYETDTVPDLEGKYLFGVWTTDPARSDPAGRVLAATPPADFDAVDDTATATDSPTATDTPAGTETATSGNAEELWDVEELVFDGGLEYFVRMFGQGPNGEVHVLVNQNGVPSGDTGAVLRLVPAPE